MLRSFFFFENHQEPTHEITKARKNSSLRHLILPTAPRSAKTTPIEKVDMVYCGKPSKACEECRLRRTKCDTLKPSCSQCVRAGRKCVGYRDPSDLMFRDEAQSLSIKRQRVANAKKSRPTTTCKAPKRADVDTDTENSKALVTPSSLGSLRSIELGTSAEDQASAFFFRNYVLEEHNYHNGNFQYLKDIYGKEEIGDCLSDGVVALGMVGLSNFWKASSIMATAHSKYNSALRLVSSRLRNVEDAKSDQTLVTVMLLGLYETNTCSSPQSMASWTKHVTGAAALLSLRGKQQLESSIGRQLFVHLRTQVITNCIQRHVPVPPSISEWSQTALQYETPEEAASTALSELAIKFASIRSTMSSFNDYSNPEYLIAALCDLDSEYTEWISRCPTEFLYSTITLKERSEDVFSDHYHVYSSIWTATVWNHYRCVRILVNELLLDQLGHVFQNPESCIALWENFCLYENQVQLSNAMLLQLSHDICSSVPFFMGLHGSFPNKAKAQPPKAVSGNLLLWPLYTAACTGMVSDMMRVWVAGRLTVISDVLGIRQAAPLAYSLGLEQELLEWEEEDIDGLGYNRMIESTV